MIIEIIKKIVIYLFCILFKPFWYFEKFIPRRKNLWIFGSRLGLEYSDNSKWLYEYVCANCPFIKAVWITKSKSVYKNLKAQKKEVEYYWSIKGIITELRSGYSFLVATRYEINPFFTNGCKVIWLWHGMPLKKIGASRNKKIYPVRTWIKEYYDYYKCDGFLSSADFFTPFLMESRRIGLNKIFNTGLPRCDVFFTNNKDSFIGKIREKFLGCKVVLYMPTFRMVDSNMGLPFNPFDISYNFDFEVFSNTLDLNNIVFIYKPHFNDKLIELSGNDRLIYLHYDDVEDTYELLNSVDALVTDYSSVYFDFLCSRKPIFLLTPDYEDYVKKSRGHYFDMFKEMSAPVCKNWTELCDALSKKSWKCPDEVEVMKFAQYSDGHSCEKIVEKIINGS